MNEHNRIKEALLPLVAAGALLTLSSCARQESRGEVAPVVAEGSTEQGRNYGFWPGLVQGMIAPVSVVGEIIFNDGHGDDIVMYSPDNNGKPYTIGFALGAGILLGSSNSARRRRD